MTSSLLEAAGDIENISKVTRIIIKHFFFVFKFRFMAPPFCNLP